MSRDLVYLLDIQREALRVQEVLQGVSRAAFDGDWKVQHIVVRCIETSAKRRDGYPRRFDQDMPKSNGTRSSVCATVSSTNMTASISPSCGKWPKWRFQSCWSGLSRFFQWLITPRTGMKVMSKAYISTALPRANRKMCPLTR
jgi:hypothetical protein